MNVWEEVKAAGRVNYSRNTSLSRDVPLRQSEDAACEWMRLAPAALVKKLTLADPEPAGMRQRLHAYSQSTAIIGKELNTLWEQGATHQEVFLEFTNRATKHFSVVQADHFVREMDNYCVTPGKIPVDQVLLDLKSRCRVALALVPDPVGDGAPKTTTLRLIRAIGQFFNWQAPMLQVGLQLVHHSMVDAAQEFSLEEIWGAMATYGQNEFKFEELPRRAAAHSYVFDPNAQAGPAAAAARAAKGEAQRERYTKESGADDKRKKGHWTMTVNLQSKEEVALQAAAYLAFLELHMAVVDQHRGGCYNCSGKDHYFLDCKADYSAAAWDRLSRARPGADKWRPNSNVTFRSLQERLQAMRAEGGNGSGKGFKQRRGGHGGGGGRQGGGRGAGGN
jgi:uncharacterized membrane protein YgcG